MSTFAHDYVLELGERWKEVDILISECEKHYTNEHELYNVLCRSTSILIVAHLEGFIKDLSRNLIHDLNSNLNFNQLKKPIQMTACKKYLGFDNNALKHYDKIINDMVTDFSAIEGFKISYESFLFDKNRNPKPESIQLVCKRFGIDDIFKNLHDSIFDGAFVSDKKLGTLLSKLEIVIKAATLSFPYKTSLIKHSLKSKKYNGRTLWQGYLDDINQTRHNIVHGNTFDNSESILEIKRRRDCAKLFQLIIVYCLCSSV